jgi:hypothetical protein
MKSRLFHTAVAVLGMILCAYAGFLTTPLWHLTNGRDIRPQATTTGVLILVFAVVVRRAFRWRASDFILGLLAVEAIVIRLIAHVSGLSGFEALDLSWLAFINLFIGLPWLLGLGAGSLWLKCSGRDA